MIRKTLFLFLLFLSFSLNIAAEESERINHQAVRVVKELTPHWTGTWATAMQTPVKAFMPYNNQMSNRSVRQIVKVSAGGDIVRLQLSNIFSTTPVVLRSVYIAPALGGHRVDSAKAVYLSFNGHRGVTIPAGKSLFSDAVRFSLKPLQLVAITVNYQTAPKVPTVHMGSRTTSYILKGESKPSTDFSHAFRASRRRTSPMPSATRNGSTLQPLTSTHVTYAPSPSLATVSPTERVPRQTIKTDGPTK